MLHRAQDPTQKTSSQVQCLTCMSALEWRARPKTLICQEADISLDRRWCYCQRSVLLPSFPLSVRAAKWKTATERRKIAIAERDFNWSLQWTSEDQRMGASCLIESWFLLCDVSRENPSENLQGENCQHSLGNRFVWRATSRKLKFPVELSVRHHQLLTQYSYFLLPCSQNSSFLRDDNMLTPGARSHAHKTQPSLQLEARASSESQSWTMRLKWKLACIVWECFFCFCFSRDDTFILLFLIFKNIYLFGYARSGGASGKEPTCQCRRCKRCGFNPWIEKIPWRRAWQPTPVFLAGESHGQRSLAGYIHWLQRVGYHWSDLACMHSRF